MKIKKNHLLTAAIMSLLGVSQSLMAAPVPTVMTLNGITKTVVFVDEAQAAAASSGSDAGLVAAIGAQFGALSPTGLVSQSTVNGVPMSIINTGGGKVAVAQPNPDGTTSYVTVTKSTTGQTATQVAQEYIKTVTNPAYTPTVPLAGLVKTGLDAATLALVQADVAAVGTNTQAPIALPTGAITAQTVIPTVTDPKTLLQYQIDQQALTNALKAATTATTATTLVDVPAASLQPGTINTVSLLPAVQLAAAKANEAATTTVTTQALTSTDPLVRNAAAQLQLDAANQLLTAATAAGDAAAIAAANTAVAAATATIAANPAETAAVTAAKAAVAAANTTLATTTPAVTTAKTAFDAAIADPNATQAQKQAAFDALNAAVTADLAAKQSALTAQQALATALNADPSATQAAKDAANAAVATLTADITATQNMLATAKLQLKDPTIVAAATTALATVATEKNKVVAALGSAAAIDVTNAAAALDAQLLAVQTIGQQSVAQKASIDLAAQNFVNRLAEVKTNQFQAKNSRSSHIAGNPMSTMNMTVDSQFREVADFGGTDNKTNIASASSDGGVTTSVGVGIQYGYYDLGGRSANTVTLPLSLTAKFNPKHQLTLSVPLSYIAVQNQSDAYQVGVGLAYKYNVTDNWAITPSLSYAYRSMDNMQNEYLDTRSSTSVVGGSISSKYTWNFAPVSVSLINMIGHFQSLDANNNATKSLNLGLGNIGTYNGAAVNNTIANYVVKNGLHATKMFGNFKVGAYFADTEYFGSGLYFRQFDEVGFTLKPVNAGKMLDALTVDANYLFSIAGKNSSQLDGFRLNLGYKF